VSCFFVQRVERSTKATGPTVGDHAQSNAAVLSSRRKSGAPEQAGVVARDQLDQLQLTTPEAAHPSHCPEGGA